MNIDQYVQLLKGTHMGACALKDLKEKAHDETLKQLLVESLTQLHQHEEWLSQELIQHDTAVPDTQGLQGMFANAMMKVKNLMLEDDEEIVKEAMSEIESGQKALQIFEEEQLSMQVSLVKQLKVMKDDYAIMYHRLHQYYLKYREDHFHVV